MPFGSRRAIKPCFMEGTPCGAFCFYSEVPFEKQLHCWSYIDTRVSGSPILQNGKLIGAVTHVLVDDPTRGYGIFIENMLNAANIPMAKAS